MEEQPDSEPSFPDVLQREITISSRSVQEALDLAGAWSDMDWDVVERELYRIRHETGKPVSRDFFESMVETLEVASSLPTPTNLALSPHIWNEGDRKGPHPTSTPPPPLQ